MSSAVAPDHGGTGPNANPVGEPSDERRIQLDISIAEPRWGDVISDAVSVCDEAAQAAFQESEVCPDLAEASLVLADDIFVAGLNKQYRDREGPTNVLSFASCNNVAELDMLPSGMPAMLGDIVIAYETTTCEATESGIAVENHLRHLVVHGVLHLLGYDHTTDGEAAVMEPLETRILARLGVADPYAMEQSNA